MIRLPENLNALRAAWRPTLAESERSERPCFRALAPTNESARPKLMVFGTIGGYESDASEFVRAVQEIDAPEIDLHVNSPGGFVYDGVAMYEALVAHPARVIVHIDGLAASAASFLAQSGDEIEIARAGRMMIHDAQGIALGSPSDMREYADLLDAVSDDIAGIYAERAGGTRKSWRSAMSATTWYSASESVSAHLADRVSERSERSQASGPDNRTRLITARHRVLTTPGGVN